MLNSRLKSRLQTALESKMSRYYGVTVSEATPEQLLHGVQLTVRDILTERRAAFNKRTREAGSKKIYYLCIEFLMGKQLRNNLMNLGIERQLSEILADSGQDLQALIDREPDLGLGNGGLGRLAACYMDSLTTLEYPATGYSILYEYGLFKQKIVDGEPGGAAGRVAARCPDPGLCRARIKPSPCVSAARFLKIGAMTVWRSCIPIIRRWRRSPTI